MLAPVRHAVVLLAATPLVYAPARTAPIHHAVSVTTPDSVGPHPAPAPTLGPLRPPLGTFHYVMLKREASDSLFRPFGQLLVVRHTQGSGTSAVLQNVAHYEWANGKATTDTTVAMVATLAPISERTHTPARIVMYDFRYLHSTGHMGPDDSLAPINDSLPQPAFNSTDLDMLVTALPLRAGFKAAIPLYDPEFPGFRIAELRVTGTEWVATASGARRAWLLSVAQPSRPLMYYRIDVPTHAMLRKDFGGLQGPWFRVQTAPGGTH
jgi:hypothetical protein